LKSLGQVIVIAPSANQSGMGTALPPLRQLQVTPYEAAPADLADIPAYALPATPAACVQVGLSGALTDGPIHMVVSGVNDTYNLGRDVVYSGTVGAALTAHLRGTPAVAASFGDGTAPDAHWDTATWAVGEVVRSVLDAPALTPALLNLNIPNLPLERIAGVEVTGLSSQTLLDRYHITRAAPRLLRLSPAPDGAAPVAEINSDAWAVERGCLSITPLQLFPDILYVAPWGGRMLMPQRRSYAEGVWTVAADAR
jgi:5'-nucleotidase